MKKQYFLGAFAIFLAACTSSGGEEEEPARGTGGSESLPIEEPVMGTGGTMEEPEPEPEPDPDLGLGGAMEPDPNAPPIVDPGTGAEPPVLGETVTIHLIGDSLVSDFPETDPTGRVGWGTVLPDLFDETVTVNNAAASGRSSKSFYNEGRWGAVREAIKPGDYVFIEFGHNDEKLEDPTRFTDPATTFRDYLNVFIGQTREKQGFAVLVTPAARLKFTGDKIQNTHRDYPAAVIAVGAATGTPVIDLTAKTTAHYELLGPVDSVPLFAEGDTTHGSLLGAAVLAGFIAEGIVEHDLPIQERLLP